MTEEQLAQGLYLHYEIKEMKEKLKEFESIEERSGEDGLSISFGVRDRNRNSERERGLLVNLKAQGATYEEAYRWTGSAGYIYLSPNETYAVLAKTTLGMIIQTLRREIESKEKALASL